MKIPKYVKGIMERSEFVLGYGYPGYTIKIHKYSEYGLDNSVNREAERLVAYARRNGSPAYVNKYVRGTHYCDQTAEVTIFDPVMKRLECYMDYKKNKKYESFASDCGNYMESKYGFIYCPLSDMDEMINNIKLDE